MAVQLASVKVKLVDWLKEQKFPWNISQAENIKIVSQLIVQDWFNESLKRWVTWEKTFAVFAQKVLDTSE